MRESPDLSLMVAMTLDRVIGKDNDLPWGPIPSDLQRFRTLTMGAGTVILGRATYDSIVAKIGRPLPGRRHIVLTRTPRTSSRHELTFVTSVDEACAAVASQRGKACVIGGAQIYELFLPRVSAMYVTTVHTHLAGDTHFPTIGSEWRLFAGEDKVCRWDARDSFETSFSVYLRK